MKISHNWLSEFLPEAKTPTELDQILTDTGLEVEGFEEVEMVKGGLKGVVVAEVLTCDKHPNADRLKVTTVSTGTDVLQVVCGAPNVAVGQKVLLATVGTVLYPTPDEPLKMKVSKIRDVESHGMLCAEDELGLGKGHDGILVLDPSTKVGYFSCRIFRVGKRFVYRNWFNTQSCRCNGSYWSSTRCDSLFEL
jgi:phenylalanyl-tRNA synthetase beta chain